MSACSFVMPHTADTWQVPRFPRFMVVLLPIGMLLMGLGVSEHVSSFEPATGAVTTITRDGRTITSTETRTVKRVVRGRIVHEADRVFVTVPLVKVHVDHRVIKVPAHRLPLRTASAAVANPLVTVTVAVPTTVYATLDQVTVTTTATVTDTENIPTTITVTVPLATTTD